MSDGMSEGALIIARAKEIRARLLSPRGIKDNGIDLQRHKRMMMQEQGPVRYILKTEPKPEKPKTPVYTAAIILIIRAVGAHFSIHPRTLVGKERTNRVTLPRQIACFLCREHTQTSSNKIASIFKKDHSTVLYAAKKIRRLMETDPRIAAHVRAVRLIYELNYSRLAIPAKHESDLAVQLCSQEGPLGGGVRSMDEGKLPAVAHPETPPVSEDHGGVLCGDLPGETGQAQA